MALLLALLVAFNSASIATDERAREHATMLAFGVPVRRILGIEVVESVVLGVAGTMVGLSSSRRPFEHEPFGRLLPPPGS